MDPHGALKKYFGYEAFRPLQREIIDDALAGRDVFALLPTGGGKSLCFQLPALLRDGLTIVVSPLIALMKDQVDALRTSGIAATFLNSTLAGNEAREHIPCDYSNDDITIGFNGRFIEDALAHLDTDEITLKFSTPTRAAIVEPVSTSEEDLLMLVMPVRLNG